MCETIFEGCWFNLVSINSYNYPLFSVTHKISAYMGLQIVIVLFISLNFLPSLSIKPQMLY